MRFIDGVYIQLKLLVLSFVVSSYGTLVCSSLGRLLRMIGTLLYHVGVCTVIRY